MFKLNDCLDLLPHGNPIKMINKIISIDEVKCVASGIVESNNPFLNHNIQLSEMAYIEMMAQTSAAYLIYNKYIMKIKDLNELKARSENYENTGYLVMLNQLDFFKGLKLGDEFTVKSLLNKEMDDYNIFISKIFLEEELISSGEITVYSN